MSGKDGSRRWLLLSKKERYLSRISLRPSFSMCVTSPKFLNYAYWSYRRQSKLLTDLLSYPIRSRIVNHSARKNARRSAAGSKKKHSYRTADCIALQGKTEREIFFLSAGIFPVFPAQDCPAGDHSGKAQAELHARMRRLFNRVSLRVPKTVRPEADGLSAGS